MSEAHALVGQVAILLGLITAAWSVVLVITRRTPGTFYLGGVLWLFAAIALAAALGAVMVVSGRLPADGLHLVYGVLALGVLPGAALIASGRDARERSIVAAVSSIVLVILLARLFQTGS